MPHTPADSRRSSTKSPVIVLAACFLFGAASAMPVLGQAGANRTTNHLGNNRNTTPPAAQRQSVSVPAVDTAALDQAKKDDASAKADEKKALAAVSAAHGKLMKGFDAKPEVIEANKKVAAAKQVYDAAGAPLLKALDANPEYKARQQAVVTADAAVTTVRTDPNATPQQRMDAAKKALEARNALSESRAEALAGNPAVARAKADLDEATAALNKLRAEFEASISSDPELAAAKKALDDAKAKTKEADDKLAAAQKDVQTQKQARETALAEQRKLDREAAAQARQQRDQQKRSSARSR